MSDAFLERSPVLAAVDIGSNSIRLEIGQFNEGRYRRVEYLKQTVRLGAGLDEQGKLSEAAMQRGMDCLASFGARLTDMPARHVRAVATQTLREARNRNAFLERAQAALGHGIEVIAGREEARLIYAGVNLLHGADTRRLVVDIGGRSTELIVGQGRQPLVAESFALGCVSMSQRFFGDGRLTRAAFEAARIAAGAELEEAQETFARARWDEVLGSSGTAGAVAQMLGSLEAAASGSGGARITREGVAQLIERCVRAGQLDELDLPGLKPERRAVIPGGLAVLAAVMESFDILTMTAARGALRHGVLGDLHQRLVADRRQGQDMRDHSVPQIQQRFAADAAQAERVGSVALALFDSLMASQVSNWLPARGEELAHDRRELAWACALHEIGMLVSHHDHHRHSAYLMAKVDAPGFSQTQQARLAQLLLGQRGGLKKLSESLAERRFANQLLCLRLAIIKCHARLPVDVTSLSLVDVGDAVHVVFTPEWAQAKPRSVFLLQEEASAWLRNGPFKVILN